MKSFKSSIGEVTIQVVQQIALDGNYNKLHPRNPQSKPDVETLRILDRNLECLRSLPAPLDCVCVQVVGADVVPFLLYFYPVYK